VQLSSVGDPHGTRLRASRKAMTDLSVRSRMRRWLNSCRESAAIRSHRVERICDFLGVYLDATHRTVSQSCDRAGSYLVVTRCCGQTIILCSSHLKVARESPWAECLRCLHLTRSWG